MADNERIAGTLAEQKEAIQRLDIEPSVKVDMLAAIDTLETAADTAAADIERCANQAQQRQEQVQTLRDQVLALPAVGVVGDILSDSNINKEIAAWMRASGVGGDGDDVIISGGEFVDQDESGDLAYDEFVADADAIDPGGMMGHIPPGFAMRNSHNFARAIQKIAFGIQHESNSAAFQFAESMSGRSVAESSEYGQRRLAGLNSLLKFAVGQLLYALEYSEGLLVERGGDLLDTSEITSEISALDRWYNNGGNLTNIGAGALTSAELTNNLSTIIAWLAGNYDPQTLLTDLNMGADADAGHGHAPDAEGEVVDYRTIFEPLNEFIYGSQNVSDHSTYVGELDMSDQFSMQQNWVAGVSTIPPEAWESDIGTTSKTAFRTATNADTTLDIFTGDRAEVALYLNSPEAGKRGYADGDWEAALAGYDVFFSHYVAEFDQQAQAVGALAAQAALPPAEFIHPADGQIKWWTDTEMAQWASSDGSAFDSLIAGTRRTLMDARQMWLGSEGLLKSVWPQWEGAKPTLTETNVAEWNNQYNELFEEVPDSYGTENGSAWGDGVTVVRDEGHADTPDGPVARFMAAVKIQLPPDLRADPFGELSRDGWSDNFAGLSYSGNEASTFPMASGRQGFGKYGWLAQGDEYNGWRNLLKQTWSSENKTVVEAFQSALYTWMQSLQCIVEAAKQFDQTMATVMDELDALHEGNPPTAAWYHAIIPDWIVAPAGVSDEQRAIQALRRRLRATMTLGGILESNIERLIFKEQCFLLSYIVPVSTYKKEYLEGQTTIGSETIGNVKPKKAPFATGPNSGNACQILDGEGYGFVNRLVVTPGSNRVNDIPHSELSNLVPMIRLFKVYSDDAAGTQSQLEFQFESNFGSLKSANPSFDPATTLGNRRKRGAGAGVKNFSFTYDGSNPFAVKKSIKATLEIFANTFDELMELRQTMHDAMQGKSYRYIDLALKTGGNLAGTDNTSDCNSGAAAVYRTQEQNNNLARLNFRLKAVVGWARPNHLAQRAEDQELLNAIYDSYVTLDLTPTVHEFNFDELGRVTLKINYLAYIEDFYDQTAFNIFANSFPGSRTGATSLTVKSIQRELNLEYWTKKCTSTEVNSIRDQYAQEINNEKRMAVQNLIRNLMEQEKLYYINLNYEQIGTFLRKGPFATELVSGGWHGGTTDTSNDFVLSMTANRGKVIGQMDEALLSVRQAFRNAAAAEADATQTELTNAWKATLFAGGNPDRQVLSYFYASDLIDIILANIEAELETLPNTVSRMQPPESGNQQATSLFVCKRESKKQATRQMFESFKKLRVLLGPVEIINQADVAEVYQANLGDMPISTKYFIEWLTDKMLSNKETIYPLTTFLNDFFNQIVRSFLNNDMCFNWNVSQNVRVQQAAIASYGGIPASNIDPVRSGTESTTGRYNVANFNEQLPILKLSPSSTDPNVPLPLSQLPVGNQFQYLVYFAGRISPTNLMTGDKAFDESKGIHHFLLGAEKGLVKNIELQKTQSPGLAEVRFEQDNYDGLRQLRVVYDAFITTYANVKVYPGTYIYIDPGGFSPNASRFAADSVYNLTQYGVGGYYMVIKSENNLAAGLSETKITAKWVHQIEAEGAAAQLNPTSTGRSSVARCAAATPSE